jgi:hypothetical protein
MKLSSGCRCPGKWEGEQQGAEKEDKLPATAADNTLAGGIVERRSVCTGDFVLHGATISRV